VRTVDGEDYPLDGPALLEYLYKEDAPAVIKDCNLGLCRKLWKNISSFAEAGGSRPVSAQVSNDSEMDFGNRNFQYRMINFDELVTEAAQKANPYFYYRSTSPNRSCVPDFWTQWPGLASHVRFPGGIPR